MDASEYKTSKVAANALRLDTFRAILRTVREQDSALADRLQAEAALSVLEPPAQYSGGPETAWVAISLPGALAEDVADSLAVAEASAVSLEGNTTPEASAAAELLTAWQRWLEHQEV